MPFLWNCFFFLIYTFSKDNKEPFHACYFPCRSRKYLHSVTKAAHRWKYSNYSYKKNVSVAIMTVGTKRWSDMGRMISRTKLQKTGLRCVHPQHTTFRGRRKQNFLTLKLECHWVTTVAALVPPHTKNIWISLPQ